MDQIATSQTFSIVAELISLTISCSDFISVGFTKAEEQKYKLLPDLFCVGSEEVLNNTLEAQNIKDNSKHKHTNVEEKIKENIIRGKDTYFTMKHTVGDIFRNYAFAIPDKDTFLETTIELTKLNNQAFLKTLQQFIILDKEYIEKRKYHRNNFTRTTLLNADARSFDDVFNLIPSLQALIDEEESNCEFLNVYYPVSQRFEKEKLISLILVDKETGSQRFLRIFFEKGVQTSRVEKTFEDDKLRVIFAFWNRSLEDGFKPVKFFLSSPIDNKKHVKSLKWTGDDWNSFVEKYSVTDEADSDIFMNSNKSRGRLALLVLALCGGLVVGLITFYLFIRYRRRQRENEGTKENLVEEKEGFQIDI